MVYCTSHVSRFCTFGNLTVFEMNLLALVTMQLPAYLIKKAFFAEKIVSKWSLAPTPSYFLFCVACFHRPSGSNQKVLEQVIKAWITPRFSFARAPRSSPTFQTSTLLSLNKRSRFLLPGCFSVSVDFWQHYENKILSFWAGSFRVGQWFVVKIFQ